MRQDVARARLGPFPRRQGDRVPRAGDQAKPIVRIPEGGGLNAGMGRPWRLPTREGVIWARRRTRPTPGVGP